VISQRYMYLTTYQAAACQKQKVPPAPPAP
jgi:hypothetical protein